MAKCLPLDEVIAAAGCAKDIMTRAVPISRHDAHLLLQALAKAGFVVAPLEPTNAMFDAYMHALNYPASTPKTIIINVGKARRRWKAMALVGMKIAFSERKAE